jgi:hypothetical protein
MKKRGKSFNMFLNVNTNDEKKSEERRRRRNDVNAIQREIDL